MTTNTRQRLDTIFGKPPRDQADAAAPAPAPAAAAPAAPVTPAVRPVTIYLPRALGERARNVCRQRELTWTELTIEAVNAHATAIAAALHPTAGGGGAAGVPVLPARQPRVGGRRTRVPGGRMEIQLRLDPAQLTGLDRQIALTGAMNRSHYVTTALQLHLGDTTAL